MSRFMLRVIAVVVYAVGAAHAAGSDDVDARFAAMQARIDQLEAKLSAQGQELAAAKAAAPATSATPDVAAPAKPSFFDTVNVSGFAAVSYLYNFNDPPGHLNFGSNAPVDLLHPDSNSFSLDELWMTVSRDSTPESRAGFRADFVYGKTASILSGNNVDGKAGNDFDLYQAYVTYLAPIGPGVTLTAGKFATLLGAEVAQSKDNFNITRGNVYNYLQPINHMGLLATAPIGPLSASFGIVDETRSFPALNADRNDNKALLWGVSGTAGPFSGSFAGTYGNSPASSAKGDKEYILDFIGKFTPNEKFSSYVNFDWISTDTGNFSTTDGYGIAAAGRLAITDATGVAGRFEYLSLQDDASKAELKIWGITGTVDHKLTDGLTLRGEVRYDKSTRGALLTGGGNAIYFGKNGAFDDSDQVTMGLEVIYAL